MQLLFFCAAAVAKGGGRAEKISEKNILLLHLQQYFKDIDGTIEVEKGRGLPINQERLFS